MDISSHNRIQIKVSSYTQINLDISYQQHCLRQTLREKLSFITRFFELPRAISEEFRWQWPIFKKLYI